MPLGVGIGLIVIVGLFVLDRDGGPRASWTLWIPVVWVSLGASRMVSQWLGLDSVIESAAQATEGNALDRGVLTTLLACGVAVLLGRREKVRRLLRGNGPLLVFFAYCAASILWSEYPSVALKRWTKAVGDFVMILVVLTDSAGSAAVERFLARVGFLLVPTSILLIKYYPELGRRYGRDGSYWSYSGVTTDKNMLGVVCLVAGLGCVWRLMEAYRRREGRGQARPLIGQGALLAMTLWLFWRADSMSSLACFVLASIVLVVTGAPGLARRTGAVHLLVAGVVALAVFSLFFDAGGNLVETLGRDSTLTGRTDLWKLLLTMNQDPWLGAGFANFWLGERLERIWEVLPYHANEAHNGYLEVFLNLGLAGVALLAVVIATGYRKVVKALRRDSAMGRLRLGYFVAGLVYGLTEAAFRELSPIWVLFMIAVVAVEGADGSAIGRVGQATSRAHLRTAQLMS
jgi:exopolysaccharide production protein ExoQ